MPDSRSLLFDAVYAAIDDLNAQRPASARLTKTPETRLTGDGGPLDSLGFVNLIVGLEQRLDGVLGTSVSLLDDERLDPTAGHFQTVQALVDYLQTLHARPHHG